MTCVYILIYIYIHIYTYIYTYIYIYIYIYGKNAFQLFDFFGHVYPATLPSTALPPSAITMPGSGSGVPQSRKDRKWLSATSRCLGKKYVNNIQYKYISTYYAQNVRDFLHISCYKLLKPSNLYIVRNNDNHMTTTWQLGSFTGGFESIGNHHTCRPWKNKNQGPFKVIFWGSNHQLGLGAC